MAVPYKLNYFEIETGIDSTSTLIHSGDLTANKIIKIGGTSNDILLGNGTTASLSGKQNAITLTTSGSSGAATLIGATLNIPDYGGALTGYVPYTGATQTLAMGTNNGITLTDTSTNSSIAITSSSTGQGAIVINKSVNGQGVTVNNAGIGAGFFASNQSTGIGITIGNESTGKGLVIGNAALATGDPFVYNLGGAAFVKAKIDYLGNITGNSFVKTSGTSSQFLKADGSVDSTAYGTGSVTSVAALTLGTTGTDLSSTVANSTTTPVITLNVPTASATNRGALSSTDWTTFNSKQNTITLTTSGSSGSSTFISNTLNVPTYTLSGLGGVPTTRTITINGTSQDLSADRTFSVGTVTSVGLSMPPAFSVASSPITSSGTIAVTGAGLASQYIRGDGQLADFPTSGGGGGSSVSYYLNGSVNQGTFGGNTYYEMNKVPVFGAGTDFTISSNGYISQFITDANDPNALLIPAGNWNFETYFSASSGGGSPSFYVELYKYNGTTFTLIASNSATPELIAFGTSINPYFSALAVPETVLTATDRLAIRIYVTNSGRTITLHTENSHLCQVITTFTTGLQALNGLTKQTQYLAVGTSGTDFAISSSVDTHTFNLPTASATNRGALSSANWSTFNNKQNAITLTTTGSSGSSTFIADVLNVPTYTLSGLGGVPTSRTITINGTSQDLSADRTYNVGTVTSVAALTLGTTGTDLSSTVANGTTTPVITLNVPDASATARGVITTGTQTIAGFKTFVNTIKLDNGTSNAFLFESGTTGFYTTLKAAAGLGADIIVTLPSTTGTLALTSAIPANPVGGTGTTNTIPKFTSSTAIGDSLFTDNGTNGGFGGANYLSGTDLRSFNISAPLYAVLGFWANNVLAADIFGYGVTGNLILSADTSNVFSNSNLIFTVDGTEDMRINSSGNVLINTTTDAGFKLDVNGTGRFSGATNALTLRSTSATTMWTEYYYNTSTLSGYIGSGSGVLSGANNSDFIIRSEADFVVATGGNNRRLTIASTGAATFNGNVSLSNSNLLLGVGATANSEAIIFSYNNNAASRSWRIVKDWTAFGDFQIQQSTTQTGTTYADILRFSPTGAATFSSSVTASGFNSFLVTATGAGADGVSDGPFIRYVNTTNSYQILKQINANTDEDTWSIRGGSWTKIGTLSGTSGIYTPLSDKNKKKDFELSTVGLNEVLGLKPTLYRMLGEENTDKILGFIAQEVKEFIPQAYVENGDDEYKFIGLNYNAITAALVKGMQEQQVQIEELKALIK